MFIPGLMTKFSGSNHISASSFHQGTSDEVSSPCQRAPHGQVRLEQILDINRFSFITCYAIQTIEVGPC